MICGLLGEKLGHSYSPAIHECFGDYEYKLFEVVPENVENFIKNSEFHGLNVTIPYKKAVMPFLDWISPEAERIGSVNTIVRDEQGLSGYNTDYFGFLYAAEKAGISFWGKKVLILGSGGASLAVQAAVADSVAKEILVASRTGRLNYSNIYEQNEVDIIINATPVGMKPDFGGKLVDLNRFTKCRAVIDLVYNPLKTKLIIEAENLGIKAVGGLAMLVGQAKFASEIFQGTEIENSLADDVLADLERNIKNIVLIGMPGCGKTTVGKALAAKLDYDFVDIDMEIEKKFGKSILEIFSQYGEHFFRELERNEISKWGQSIGIIIATGGGAVLDEQNCNALRQNGFVFFLNRDINKLEKEGRPLSIHGNLDEIYKRRFPLYKKNAEIIVENTGTIDDTVNEILISGGYI